MGHKPDGKIVKGNCWDCRFVDLSGIYFPGRCNWFKEVKKEEPKELPPERVDRGCQFFEPAEKAV